MHLHLVDAAGSDGEGLQKGEGEIDFGMTARILDELAPQASFIPEIWQGPNGEGVWIALDGLEHQFLSAVWQRSTAMKHRKAETQVRRIYE